MKDIEIYNWLYELKPESMEQERKIHRMMRVILEDDYKFNVSVNTEKFLNTLTLDDVLGKPSKELYERYSEWCKKEKINAEAKNVFSMSIIEIFNVKSRVIRINGKCTRVFK